MTTEGNRELFSGLLLCTEDQGKLRYVGNVGTGFDQKMMQELHRLLKPLIVSHAPVTLTIKRKLPVTWVRPEITARIQFLEWTEDGHLRAPVFLGLAENDPEPERKERFQPGQEEVSLKIGKRSIRFTNLQKVFYPKDGYTKRDILNYYDAVADLLIPYWKD